MQTGLIKQIKQLFLKELNLIGNPLEMSQTYLSFLVEHSTLWKGAKDLLKQLSPDDQMAGSTNGVKEVQRPRLALTQIDHYFKTIVVSDEIGVAKPQSGFFDYTFEQIQQPPKNRVLVIGDSLNSDMKGGQNYGVDTCWFNPLGKGNLTEVVPTYESRTLRDLVDNVLDLRV